MAKAYALTNYSGTPNSDYIMAVAGYSFDRGIGHNHETQVIPLREKLEELSGEADSLVNLLLTNRERLEKVEKEKRGFEKTVDLQRPLLSEYYAEIQRLREALIRIVNVCDNQNPTHESIWRIANELLTKEG